MSEALKGYRLVHGEAFKVYSGISVSGSSYGSGGPNTWTLNSLYTSFSISSPSGGWTVSPISKEEGFNILPGVSGSYIYVLNGDSISGGYDLGTKGYEVYYNPSSGSAYAAYFWITDTPIPGIYVNIPSSGCGNNHHLTWPSDPDTLRYKVFLEDILIYEGPSNVLEDKGSKIIGNTYTYTINRVTAAGEFPLYESTFTNTSCGIDPPNVKAKGCGSSVTILWEPVTNATFYRVYRNDVLVYEGVGVGFVDSGLVIGVKYLYKVEAI